MPFLEVAEDWGLLVTLYAGKDGSPLGSYAHGKAIALGVENYATWCHELVHAADDKLGTLGNTRSNKAKAQAEIVAELGGATLLTIIGEDVAADVGGAWDYIEHYSTPGDPITQCSKLIERVCNCLDLIIQTATALKERS